jgi:hypothetical protein
MRGSAACARAGDAASGIMNSAATATCRTFTLNLLEKSVTCIALRGARRQELRGRIQAAARGV